MNKNLYALAFVLLTQTACAAFYSMDPPVSFGHSNFRSARDLATRGW